MYLYNQTNIVKYKEIKYKEYSIGQKFKYIFTVFLFHTF